MTTMTAPRQTRAKVRTAPGRRCIKAEDLLRLELVCDPQISPDGRAIVYTKKHFGEKNEYVTNLWLVATSANGAARRPAPKPRQFTSGGRDSHARWSPDGRRLAFIGRRDKHKPQIFTISADGGEAIALTKFPEGTIRDLRWSPDGRRLAAAFREQAPQWTQEAAKDRKEKGLTDPPRVLDDWWYRLDGDGYFDAQRFALYLIDAETGAWRRVYAKDTLGFFSYDFSPDSRTLAITTNQDRKAMIRPWKDQILIMDIASGKFTRVPDLPNGPKDGVAWSPDGTLLAYASREGKDHTYSTENLELWVCDPARGRARSLTGDTDHCLMSMPITDTAEVDFSPHLCWSADSGRILALVGWHGEGHIAAVSVAGSKTTFLTKGAVDHALGNLSADGRRIALCAATAVRPAEIHLGQVSATAIRTTAVTDHNGPFFGELKVSSITSHWIKSADGNRVQVWVMMPPDHQPGSRKKYPGILEIHGGPHGQYGVGFFHEFQVLAAAGYVVFFSNPRGSKGYGRDHCAAIRGSWGGADWVDIQAVIKLMQEHPHVDPQRLGVMGGSYGGYMTNWVIGHTNDFAGAITDRCVSNVVTLGGTGDFVEEPDRYFPGNFWDRPEGRWEQSPIKYIGNARTPTLIIHSEGDLRCNIEQAEQVFTALKLLGVPTRFVRYPRSTSHGLSRSGPPDMRLHRLNQILGWWRKYLK